MTAPYTITGTTAHVRATGSILYRWPTGWRYVQAPQVCQGKGCQLPAAGLLSWHNKRGLLYDFAGCSSCARDKRQDIEAQGMTVRASRLGSEATS